MMYAREHPLGDLGKGLRERLDAGLENPPERMHALLERMTGLLSPQEASDGNASCLDGKGPGA